MNTPRPTHFYDSAAPHNIPSGVWAGVYINGFAWDREDILRMARIFRISVRPEAFWAARARCIDVQSGAASPEDVVPFIHERRGHGYHDQTAYVNRSNIGDVHERVMHERERIRDNNFTVRYWLATLDGSAPMEYEGLRLWAVQDQGGMNAGFDRSVLYGIHDLVKP